MRTVIDGFCALSDAGRKKMDKRAADEKVQTFLSWADSAM
jgi:hypothetical protein